mmetsp:Transcript_17130/g.37758  ORF Transcript_17130/g.37758 Transcript_17130/m.37758 type:complete len:219 (+) Transcript_17130:850-1506(+)
MQCGYDPSRRWRRREEKDAPELLSSTAPATRRCPASQMRSTALSPSGASGQAALMTAMGTGHGPGESGSMPSAGACLALGALWMWSLATWMLTPAQLATWIACCPTGCSGRRAPPPAEGESSIPPVESLFLAGGGGCLAPEPSTRSRAVTKTPAPATTPRIAPGVLGVPGLRARNSVEEGSTESIARSYWNPPMVGILVPVEQQLPCPLATSMNAPTR